MIASLIKEDMYFRLGNVCRGTFHIKIEGLNPAGSIKIKTALAMIEDMEMRGRISKNTCLIESSSGNLGVSLAMVCAERGYRFICVVDPNTSEQNKKLICALGAELIVVDKKDGNGGYLATRIELIKELLETHPHYVWLNQYQNPANALAHYHNTARSIAEHFQRIDYLFVGAGTTGTLMGCKNFFAKHRPETKVIGVDSVGSVTFGLPASPRFIPGIGTSRTPEIFDPTGLHGFVMVPEIKTIRTCRWVAKNYGVLVGGSTGTVISAVRDWYDRIGADETVIAVSPDMGDRYLDTIYTDDWVKARFGDLALKPVLDPVTENVAA